VIIEPNKEQPFDKDGNLNGQVLGREKGTIFNVPAFVDFLRGPLEKSKQLSSTR
jgi:hypothetical protein